MNFESIYKEFHNPVLNWIGFKIQNISDAEELTNDVFIKVFEHLLDFNAEKASIKTWIFTIVSNSIIDYYRTKGGTFKGKKIKSNVSIDSFESEDENYTFAVPDKGIKADSLHDNKIVGVNTLKAINSLKPKYKSIAIEYFVNEKSYNEIVETLNFPLTDVKVSINRIRTKLQSMLQKEYQLI